MRRRAPKLFRGVLLGLALASCTSLGPRMISVDRFDYVNAIADSWKQQTLLNIVKMRYMDLPVFVDVASIVSGYSLQTGVSVTGTLASDRAVSGDFGSLTGQGIYIDRPTITYVPLTGEKFLSGLVAPIDPTKIFFLLQSGYAANFLLALTVESINGVRNRSAVGTEIREADPEFVSALDLIRDIQVAGAVAMRLEQDAAKTSTAILLFRSDDAAPEILAKIAEIRRLLKLTPDARRYVLKYSPMRGAPDELSVNSRSMLQIMGAFASYLDVPEAHVQDHSALPGLEGPTGVRARIHIYSGRNKPASAFACIRYRDHWFWVDDGDWLTKRALTAVMFFFTLSEASSTAALPLITIPSQ